jgi:tetratricopeptide (TPR) repeat protein
MGEIEEFDSTLRARLERDPFRGPLILEALAEGYARMYRVLEAQNCLVQWLNYEPDNTRALFLRGKALQQVRRWEPSVADFRRVVELDPEQDDARQRLVLGLLELSRYEEALGHLEHLRKDHGSDIDLQVRMARCYHGMGQSKQARQILEGVLQKDPEHGAALFLLGKVALMAGQLDEAERWLRQAARVMPYDYATQWHLYEALRRQDENSAQARDQLARAENLKQRWERLSDITTRKFAVRPHDATLHYEAGMLLMELGNKDLGARWLSCAIKEKKGDYPEAQLALAEYFEERGDKQTAEEYRKDAQASATSSR